MKQSPVSFLPVSSTNYVVSHLVAALFWASWGNLDRDCWWTWCICCFVLPIKWYNHYQSLPSRGRRQFGSPHTDHDVVGQRGDCWPGMLHYAWRALQICFYEIFNSLMIPARWNEHQDILIHLPSDCLFSRLFKYTSKKTSTVYITGLCDGNPSVTGEFTKGQ